MRGKAASRAAVLLILAGFAAFLLAARFANGLRLPLLLLFFLWVAAQTKKWRNALPLRVFLPFATGLLLLPMRLFYWDRGDFSRRAGNLFLLAALFALCLLARERRWPGRFLRRFNSQPLKKRLWLVFAVSELLFILAAGLLTRQGVALSGDEPHYLAISQSLARDGDLNVFNQYKRGGYKEFLDVENLPAHGTWGKGFKKIYSYHLPGVALTVLPFFFLRLSPPLLYFLLRSWLGLFGALLAVLVYLFGLRLWRSRSLAFFAAAVFTLSAPVFFYSVHVFPEVQATLLLLGALYILFYKCAAAPRRALWAGLLLGSTIFWGVKYAIFVYPITLGFCAYWLWRRQYRHALFLIAFPLLFQGLFFAYLYMAYGRFSPNAIYTGMLSAEQAREFYDILLNKITLRARAETLLDYFFDQRDGLLLYNPFYFFAFPGLLLALKNFRRYRVHLLAAVPALLFILNHAFSTIRAGYCPQGRYLAPATWALLLFALVYYRESRNRLWRRVFLALPLYSLFVTAYQLALPATLYQPTTHDTVQRAGMMFQNWSNSRIDLPSLLPSFVKVDNRGYLPNALFLALFALLVVLALANKQRLRPSCCRGILAPTLVFLGAFSLACLFPRLDRTHPQPIRGPRDLPCAVYFSTPAHPAAEAASWLCSGSRCRLRLETMVPLKAVQIRIQSRSSQEPLTVTAALFDAQAPPLQLSSQALGRLRWERPRYKRIKARYGYQFELRARGGPEGVPGDWLLGLELR